MRFPAVVVEGFNIKITVGDLLTLEWNKWLGDSVLEFYIKVNCASSRFVSVYLLTDDRGEVRTGWLWSCLCFQQFLLC